MTIPDEALQAMPEAISDLLKEAYLLGFSASAEGYNSEYPFNDDEADILTDDNWLKRRDRILSAIEPAPSPRAQALEEAARNLIANRFDTYKGRNGKQCSIEGDDGEKCWIVSFDDMSELEIALSQPIADRLPQDVINLVIAAREAFEAIECASFDIDVGVNLDKALEAFASRVPYENDIGLPAAPEVSG